MSPRARAAILFALVVAAILWWWPAPSTGPEIATLPPPAPVPVVEMAPSPAPTTSPVPRQVRATTPAPEPAPQAPRDARVKPGGCAGVVNLIDSNVPDDIICGLVRQGQLPIGEADLACLEDDGRLSDALWVCLQPEP